MRFFLTGLLALIFGAYGGTSFFFFEQEKWARHPERIDLGSIRGLRHPEATLGVTRYAIEANDFSDRLRPHLYQSLREAPASYQSSFLLAAFLANRLEAPELTESAFEAAVRLSPANGRLRLTFAQWLFTPKWGPPSPIMVSPSNETRVLPARWRGLDHLKLAMALEPDLVPEALGVIAWSGVPADEWHDFVPKTVSARKHLAQALEGHGHRDRALSVLAEMLDSVSDGRLFEDAARWAFEWGDSTTALRVGEKWLAEERRSGGIGLHLARATLVITRAHLELGRPEKAYEIFRTALQEVQRRSGASSPASVELLRGMGYQYLRMDQTVMAESLLLRAIEAAPRDAASRLVLARLYRRVGNRRAAIDSYREVLRLHPQNPQADRELRQLLLVGELPREGS